MTQIKQHTANGHTWVIVEVPIESYGHYIHFHGERFGLTYNLSANLYCGFAFFFKDFGGRKKYPAKLNIHCLAHEAPEEQTEQVVDKEENRYKDYAFHLSNDDEYCSFYFAGQSLQSLIRSLFPETHSTHKFVIIEKLA